MHGDLRISHGKIQAVGSPLEAKRHDAVITFGKHVVYPGLVNAHDHLEMNLYPLMGNPPYQNYTQWARDIYRPAESPVREIESIPLKDRLLWGGIKNLISGVTTVVHHNPYYPLFRHRNFPVRVFANYSWAHSLAFEKSISKKFPTFTSRPFIVHAAEGVDELAQLEIQQLKKLKVLRKNTVLVHAIGTREQDRVDIQNSGASIVWCPSSNLFMFNKTLDAASIQSTIPVALGTDSTMTGKATLFDEMAVARLTGQSASSVLDMVTSVPRKIFRLSESELSPGHRADLLILPQDQEDYAENLVTSSAERVAAVLVDGEMRFGESGILSQGSGAYHAIKVGGKSKVIAHDLASLMDRLSAETDRGFFDKNPLWALLNA